MTLPAPPAPERDRAALAAGLAQLCAFVAVLAGVYLLAGVAWTLVIGGSLVLGASVLVEYLATRSPRPLAAPAPGGDR